MTDNMFGITQRQTETKKQTDRRTDRESQSPVLASFTMTENMFGIGILYLMKDLGERSRSDSEHSAGYTQHRYVQQ